MLVVCHVDGFVAILTHRCELGAAPLNVAMLLSGGVDSSLAMTLVKAAGVKGNGWCASGDGICLHHHCFLVRISSIPHYP